MFFFALGENLYSRKNISLLILLIFEEFHLLEIRVDSLLYINGMISLLSNVRGGLRYSLLSSYISNC